ncbi:T9SS type A sorting domain-containing protein [bacterium]|nr:T9SS type A sorting domain-containing protein [bacterium]
MKKYRFLYVCLVISVLAPLTLEAFHQDEISQQNFYSSSSIEEYEILDYLDSKELAGRDQLWESFLKRYPGNWKVRINGINGLPHRVWGGRIEYSDMKVGGRESIIAIAERFLNDNSALLKLNRNELRLFNCEKHGKLWYLHYEQVIEGVRVYRSRVDLRIFEDGAIVLFGANHRPGLELDLEPAISEPEAVNLAIGDVGFQVVQRDENTAEKMIYSLVAEDMSYEDHLVWKLSVNTESPPGSWLYIIDAHTGEVLLKYNQYRFYDLEGDVTGWVKPHYYDDASVEEEMSYIRLNYNSDVAYANVRGYYFFDDIDNNPHTLSSTLVSPYVDVDYEDGSDGSFSASVSTSDSPYEITWSTTYALVDEINVFYHTNFVHDFVKHTLHYNGMDYQMPATVRVGDSYDNAYWDGYGINFGEGGSYFWNLALFCEIIYHEYTHGVTHYIYPEDGLPYTGQSGAMDEGFSDYFACSMTGDPQVGERCYRSSSSEIMRTLDNIHSYPYNFIGEVHHDGTIFGGALWDLRDEIGLEITDSITHQARFGFPDNFEDYIPEILLADDDDGDVDNGTPHIRPILEHFDFHGIGPGYTFEFDHDPLPDTEDSVHDYHFTATLLHVIGMLPESTFVYYSVDDGSTWEHQILTYHGSDEFEGYIPAQPYGTTVKYFLKSQDVSYEIAYSPTSGSVSPHIFNVGLDTENPTIVHSPLPDQSLISWPAMVRCEVRDNLGIAEVNCGILINSVSYPDIEMTRVEGTDEYRGSINYAVEVGDIVEYQIEAIDASAAGNTTYFHPVLYFSFEILSYYLEPMEYIWLPYFSYNHTEGHPDTMQTYGNQWHLSGVRNHTAGGSRCWKCGAYDLSEYENLLDAALVSPYLRLGSNSRLFFWQYIEAETSRAHSGRCYDGGIVEITTDAGDSWEQITPEEGYPFTIRDGSINGPFYEMTPCFSGLRYWEQQEFNLSEYTGIVQIRWRFGTDGAVSREGWYIDDVKVESESVFVMDHEGVWKPAKVELRQNFPNPFNSMTSITAHYELQEEIKLRIFDILGNMVREFKITPEANKNNYEVLWNGENDNGVEVPSGVYFYRLDSQKHSESRKCLLIR